MVREGITALECPIVSVVCRNLTAQGHLVCRKALRPATAAAVEEEVVGDIEDEDVPGVLPQVLLHECESLVPGAVNIGVDDGDVETLPAWEALGAGLRVLDAVSRLLDLALVHVAVGQCGMSDSEGVVGFDSLGDPLKGAVVHGEQDVQAIHEEVGGSSRIGGN